MEDLRVMLAFANLQAASGIKEVLKQHKVPRIFVPEHDQEAVMELQNRSFNLLIVEETFPKLSGIDFCKFIRLTSGPTSIAPIIYGVHSPSRESVIEARDAGVNKIAIMPFTGASLMRAVEGVLKETRPMVRALGYTGPERRINKQPEAYKGRERRIKDGKTLPIEAQRKILIRRED